MVKKRKTGEREGQGGLCLVSVSGLGGDRERRGGLHFFLFFIFYLFYL